MFLHRMDIPPCSSAYQMRGGLANWRRFPVQERRVKRVAMTACYELAISLHF